MEDFDIDISEEDSLVIESVTYNEQAAVEEEWNSEALQTYMRQLSQFPLLTREQELVITKKLKKQREILYLAFLEDKDCIEILVRFFEQESGKIRRIFDHIAKSVNDDNEVRKLQEKVQVGLKTGAFSKKELKNFKDLVLPVNEFYQMINILVKKPMQPKIKKSYDDFCKIKKTLVECNTKLVFSRAKRFINKGLSIEDLIQEGNIGLLKAVEKYDPSKGHKFGTYATWWIDQAFGRALADKGKLVRIPVHMLDSINKVNRTYYKLLEDLGRDATDEELAKHSNLSVGKIKKIKNVIILKTKSLEEFTFQYKRKELADESHENNQNSQNYLLNELSKLVVTPEDFIQNEEFQDEVRKLLSTLKPRQEKLLRLKFGIGERKLVTVEETANKLKNIKRSVRKIRKKRKLDVFFQ